MKDHAILEIRDQGIGMDDETQKELFKPGIRSKKGTANESGTGIGLTLCYEFISRLNGKIWLKVLKQGYFNVFYGRIATIVRIKLTIIVLLTIL
ncbi:hypothetical protein MASR1M107_20350 [Ignavibacteriales bacterium]